MYDDYRIVAVIPARGGSKGIKGKNIHDLCGKPLINYTIEAANESDLLDRVIVSTDDDRIADVARLAGADVPFKRPVHLATDEARTIDVLLHTIEELKKNGENYNLLVLLQPTSPFRTSSDIDKSIKTFVDKKMTSLASVKIVEENPLLMKTLKDNKMTSLFNHSSDIRRQDMENYYILNGAIYINRVEDLTNETSLNDNEYGFVMDDHNSIDIDEYSDLEYASYLLSKKI